MGRLFFACDSVLIASFVLDEVNAMGCGGEDVLTLEFLPSCPI